MRLTMNPGVDLACTGVLPQARLNSKMASATPRSVCKPDTTSTNFINGTGLKKCMPTNRPGCCMPLAMAVTEMDEVLVARMASAATSASSCLTRPRLASRFSTMASTTTRAPRASSSVVVATKRPKVCSAAMASMRPLATKPVSVAPSLVLASAAAPGRASCSQTGCPACAATWAMPAPMMPAPITRMGAPDKVLVVMVVIVQRATAHGANARRGKKISTFRGASVHRVSWPRPRCPMTPQLAPRCRAGREPPPLPST